MLATGKDDVVVILRTTGASGMGKWARMWISLESAVFLNASITTCKLGNGVLLVWFRCCGWGGDSGHLSPLARGDRS